MKMSKQKKKYIREVAGMFWVRGDYSEKDSVSCAEQLADELEKRGYFDPEPKPVEKEIPWTTMNFSLPNTEDKPEPVETENPWRVANWEDLPENGAEIEIKDVNFIHHSKYYFCLSEKMCKKQNEKYPPVKWGTLVEYKAEWRYA